jgi:hypothetical protein
MKKEDFIQWLKDHHAYSNYINSYTPYNNNNANLNKWIDKTQSSYLISNAFIWQDSKQGHKYWSRLNKLWKKYVKTL